MKRQKVFEEVKKSAGAAIMIGLGDFALLKLGQPIGPVIFAFGLLGVCCLGLNLFTGKCGFLFEKRRKIRATAVSLVRILAMNLVVGYLLGWIFSKTDTEILMTASEKVAGWSFSLPFFIKSVLCGIVMFIAVKMYKEGTVLGIMFGIPLFIFSGFQHCIANVITLGASGELSLVGAGLILFCAAGNFLGSVIMWWVCGGKMKK